VSLGTAVGGLCGAMWGSLIRPLFLNPPASFALPASPWQLRLGGAVGVGPGELSGTLISYCINDDFVRSIGTGLKPATSTFIVRRG
jgi:uncharacterized membrane protein